MLMIGPSTFLEDEEEDEDELIIEIVLVLFTIQKVYEFQLKIHICMKLNVLPLIMCIYQEEYVTFCLVQ